MVRPLCVGIVAVPSLLIGRSTLRTNPEACKLLSAEEAAALVGPPLVLKRTESNTTFSRRELLADATAVRLTRNPDGLAGALERFSEAGSIVPHADRVSYLFASWWPGAVAGQGTRPIVLFARKTHVTPARRLDQLVAMGAHLESAPVALDQSPVRAALVGFLAIAFVNVVGGMMCLAMCLTSIELFALGAIGLWITHQA